MKKTHAIKRLGGTNAAAAAAIGISTQAVGQWPDILSPKIADRVAAAVHRRARVKPALPLCSKCKAAAKNCN